MLMREEPMPREKHREAEDRAAEELRTTLFRAVEAAVGIDGLPRDRALGVLTLEAQRNALLLLSAPDKGDPDSDKV
jgi:hypothetical protein